MWEHVGASVSIVLCGFLVAAGVGFGAGVGVALSRWFGAVLGPLADAVRGVPALAVFPLIIVALGLGLTSKVFVIFWTAWPAVFLSTITAIRQVDRHVHEAAQLDGAGRYALLVRVTLPLASMGILTGLRVGLSGGWISLTAAEMLGASRGLGYFVLSSSQAFQFPDMYAGVVLIAGLGFAMNRLLLMAQGAIGRHYGAENM